MSELLPLATYNLKVTPYVPTPAIDALTPVTVRLTLAAVDPESVDEEDKPSTLRIIKRNPNFIDNDEIDEILGDFDEDEVDVEEEEEVKEEVKETKKNNKKGKGKKAAEPEPESEEEEEEEEEEDDEFQEYVVLTLYPKGQAQQSLDITIAPEEELMFIVTGSYPIYLTGNFVKHPFDQPLADSECGSDCDSEDDELDIDSSDYDDEEEEEEEEDSYYQDALDELEDASDIEGRIEELIEKEETGSKKRKSETPATKKQEQEQEKEVSNKKQKTNEKSVKFKKGLEEGPTKKEAPAKKEAPVKKEAPAKKEDAKKETPAKKEAAAKKETPAKKEAATKKEAAAKKETPAKKEIKTQILEGGIIVEDRNVGAGKKCKRGDKVGMRYVGKLKKNGSVFDKNTNGKPFIFNLGRGEVIKGWDIGVAGMAVGGERRIIIPSAYAYGSQALPGIPKNSDMIFDVKLVSMK